MSGNSSWAPNEDSQTLFSERCWLQGVFVSTLAYGINFCLYFITLHYLVRSQNRLELKKRLPVMIYITTLFGLATVFMISLAGFTQMAFIDDRNYPGGPSAFEDNEFSLPLEDTGNVAFVVTNWLCDALMVWRVKVIYQTSSFPIWIVLFFPCLMLACTVGTVLHVGLGILFLIQVSTMNPYVTSGINFTLPYLSVSLVFNMFLTTLIVARLLSFRYRIASLLGPNHGKQYTSVASIMVESVALYSVMSLAFLILFGIKNAVSQVFLQSLSQIQTMAALLIVFRIAQGKGWTTEMTNHGMTMQTKTAGKAQFASRGGSCQIAEPAEMETNARDEELRDGLRISGDVFAREPLYETQFRGQYSPA